MGRSYYPDLIEILKAHNCVFIRQGGKGSHEIWCSPINKRHFTVHTSCKNRASALKVLKDAGIKSGGAMI